MTQQAVTREGIVFEESLMPSDVKIIRQGLDGVLSLTLNGQTLDYVLNRRLLFGLMAQSASVLQEMEPGKWVPNDYSDT